MSDALYRAEPPDALRIVPLDAMTLIYHRRSGITHLVASPAPEILEALGEEGLTRAALLDHLSAAFDLTDAGEGALDARLAELIAAGLVRTA